MDVVIVLRKKLYKMVKLLNFSQLCFSNYLV